MAELDVMDSVGNTRKAYVRHFKVPQTSELNKKDEETKYKNVSVSFSL